MRDLLVGVVIGFNWLVLAYALVVALVHVLLVAAGSVHTVRTLRRDVVSRTDDVFAHPTTPGVSVLVPAHNEERTIVEAVRSVLALRYPLLEVVVVDDGSTDGTFEALRSTFDLVEVPRAVPDDVAVRGRVHSTHAPRSGDPLLVIRKEGVGRCADALNAALNAARMPLVCMVDADSVIEPDALLHVVRPFVEQPDVVVATGGVIRPSNGVGLHRGSVTSVRAPDTLLARAQVVEYLRAFLFGRVGWTWLDGVLIISGAFGLFRRADVVALGGLDADSLGQDADLVARLHRRMRDRGAPYRMVIVPQPVCWTEVPQSRRDLAQQRQRWSQGLAQVLWAQRHVLGRRRYGRFGLLVLPYHLLFELLGPVVEILGIPIVIAATALGVLDSSFALLVLLASVGFGTVLSLVALLLDEAAFHRYESRRDLAAFAVATVLESTVLRFACSWWRVRGLLEALYARRRAWGHLTRVGFRPAP